MPQTNNPGKGMTRMKKAKSVRSSDINKRTYQFEFLEDRTVPTTFAVPWPEPDQLTLSFAPDGAEIGHAQNDLFQTLDQNMDTRAWQLEILRAFQTWIVHINANIGLVTDTGAAFGAIGLSQGDPRFGDIRIAGFNQPNDIIANNVPYQPVAGSWAGDVFINTAANFGIGRSAAIDLFSVMLNEAGNVLGLEDTTQLGTAMYTDYAGLLRGLSSIDITRIQALYGQRTPDNYEGSKGNDSTKNATTIQTPLLDLGTDTFVINADITTNRDVDYYKFRAPLNGLNMQFRLNTSGISLLTGKLSVYNQLGVLIDSVSAQSVFDGDLSLHVNTVPGMTYYVKVEGAVNDVFGIGAYRLEVDINALADRLLDTTVGLVDTTVDLVNNIELIDRLFTEVGLVNKESKTNDTFATAIELQTPPGYAPYTRYEAVESLATDDDVDMYRFHTPATASPVMLVTLGSLGDPEMDLQVSVFDADGNEVKANVYRNSNGEMSVELLNAKPDADYYLKVTKAPGSVAGGNYFVVIDFGSGTAQLQDVANGTLQRNETIDATGLTVTKSQLFRFTLTIQNEREKDTAIQMTIYDRNHNVVLTMAVVVGDTRTRYVWLDKGEYVIAFNHLSLEGAPVRSADYRLQAAGLSDDVGPMGEDPTEYPVDDPANDSPPDGPGSWYAGAGAAEWNGNTGDSSPPNGPGYGWEPSWQQPSYSQPPDGPGYGWEPSWEPVWEEPSYAEPPDGPGFGWGPEPTGSESLEEPALAEPPEDPTYGGESSPETPAASGWEDHWYTDSSSVGDTSAYADPPPVDPWQDESQSTWDWGWG